MSQSTLLAFERHLQALGKRPKTIDVYGSVVSRCITTLGKPVEEILSDDIYEYLVARGASRIGASWYNVTYWSLVCWMQSRGLPLDLRGLLPKPVPVSQPRWFTAKEVRALLGAVAENPFRMVFQTMVATGMRVSEVCALQVTDIDPERPLIHVRCGKGGDGRHVLLPDVLRHRLQAYWRITRPKGLLFWRHAGSDPRPMLTSTLNEALKRAALIAGITDKVTTHRLRHTFAMHSLRAGQDLACLQKLMGHRCVSSTVRYLTPDLAKESKVVDLLTVLEVAP